jgi:Outer membrane protein and related peptidoglycan-associated (lipo)proteins
LLGLNNIETYYQILNIIGKRLIEKPEANITLGGYLAGKGAEKNKINIAKQRAEAVKDYYVNVWGIDESRIKIKTGKKPPVASNEATNQGVEENRRVEISSDDLSILAPLNINDTLRNVKPSGLRFKTDINSEKPVTQWSMKIKPTMRKSES